MLKSKKGYLLAIFLIILSVVIIVVTLVKIAVGYNGASNAQIPDTNGDNKSLCSIDTAYIESVTEGFDLLNHNFRQDSSSKSGVVGKFDEKDLIYSNETTKSLSGVYICNAYKSSGKPVHYNVSSVVNSGNLRIVVTDSKNKILYDIPVDQTYHLEFDTIKGEIYYLKLIGESANLSVTVMRSE